MTNLEIANQWREIGVRVTSIEAGEIFYSGFSRANNDSSSEEFLDGRHSIWLSKYLEYAGEYSYRAKRHRYKEISKIIISRRIDVLEFPLNFHPGMFFFEWKLEGGMYKIDPIKVRPNMPSIGVQPDHYIDQHFNDIVQLLGIEQRLSGYIRRAIPKETNFELGEIKEFSLIDKTVKEFVAISPVPDTKDDFHRLIEEHGESLDSVLFTG